MDPLCAAFCRSFDALMSSTWIGKRKPAHAISKNQGKISSQRTGAASCRQFGTMRWEPRYSKLTINVNNVVTRISWLPQWCIHREHEAFREGLAAELRSPLTHFQLLLPTANVTSDRLSYGAPRLRSSHSGAL